MKIYLASSSPRRAELLRQIGVKFDIISSEIDESRRPSESIDKLVTRLSGEKALQGLKELEHCADHDLVIAADTLIGLGNEIIGKPRSKADCCFILEQLSARRHQVHSAVAVVNGMGDLKYLTTVSEISFKTLTKQEVQHYCATNEPHDKAGAYAIQGMAACFINNISGSYSAVMGLPLFETAQLLQEFGYPLLGLVNSP